LVNLYSKPIYESSATPQNSIPHGNLNPTPLSPSLHPNHNTDLTTEEYRWKNTDSKIRKAHIMFVEKQKRNGIGIGIRGMDFENVKWTGCTSANG